MGVAARAGSDRTVGSVGSVAAVMVAAAVAAAPDRTDRSDRIGSVAAATGFCAAGGHTKPRLARIRSVTLRSPRAGWGWPV